jgi:hypothetical protein
MARKRTAKQTEDILSAIRNSALGRAVRERGAEQMDTATKRSGVGRSGERGSAAGQPPNSTASSPPHRGTQHARRLPPRDRWPAPPGRARAHHPPPRKAGPKRTPDSAAAQARAYHRIAQSVNLYPRAQRVTLDNPAKI